MFFLFSAPLGNPHEWFWLCFLPINRSIILIRLSSPHSLTPHTLVFTFRRECVAFTSSPTTKWLMDLVWVGPGSCTFVAKPTNLSRLSALCLKRPFKSDTLMCSPGWEVEEPWRRISVVWISFAISSQSEGIHESVWGTARLGEPTSP